jgi:predicted N-acetyltransferase YhbS
MGNNFPRVISLKENPQLLGPTIALIEKSFHYQAPNRFATDFAPLMDESNHHNCFVLESEEGKVIAHIGVRETSLTINGEDYPFAMLGGIAVDESERGQGHFQELMTHVMSEKRDEVAFLILWSDQEKLYKKFGFHLCGSQFEYLQVPSKKGTYEQTKYHLLTLDEQRIIQELYRSSFQQTFLTVNRSSADWDVLKKISSSDLFIKKDNNSISDYFFRGKGQDLENIIFEYGSISSLEKVFNEARTYGKVWSSIPFEDTETSQYQFFMAPGDSRILSLLVKSYTQGQIEIRAINQVKQEAYFDFNEETLSLSIEEFLQGIFGPGSFEELGELRPIFISGLDSI